MQAHVLHVAGWWTLVAFLNHLVVFLNGDGCHAVHPWILKSCVADGRVPHRGAMRPWKILELSLVWPIMFWWALLVTLADSCFGLHGLWGLCCIISLILPRVFFDREFLFEK